MGAHRILVVFALCCLLGGVSGAARLEVDSLADPGVLGDGTLTLREAIRLATGDIACGPSVATCLGLSAQERSQVDDGVPGPGVADAIVFGVSGRIVLAGDGTAQALPPLSSGDDAIDGGDEIVIDGSGLPSSQILWGLRITSGGNVLMGLAFEDVPGTAVLVTAPPGGTVMDNRILGNRFTRSGIDAIRLLGAALPAVGATVAGGTVDGTVIANNLIESGTPGNLVHGFRAGAVNVIAAYAPGAGTISGATISDTTLEGNTVRDVFQGVFVRAAAGSGTLTGNQVVGFTARWNVFERVNDQTLVVNTTNVQAPGRSSDNLVQGVLITENTFLDRVFDPSEPYLGGGPFVSGGFLDGCATTSGTATSIRDRTTDVVISHNVVRDRAPYGIYVQGTQSCGGGGGVLTDSVVQRIVIESNTIEASGTGISLTGGSSFLTQGEVANERNELRDVVIAKNLVRASDIVGLELIGGVSNQGAANRNTIAAVDVQDNDFEGNAAGIALNGGVTIGAGDRANGNVLRAVRLAANRIVDSPGGGIIVQPVVAVAGSVGNENLIDEPEITGNTIAGCGGVGMLVIASSGDVSAGPERNRVVTPRIAENRIAGIVTGMPGSPAGVGILVAGTAGNVVERVRIQSNAIDGVADTGIMLVKTRGHEVLSNQVANFGRKPFLGRKKNRVRGNSWQRRG